jgi:hypothetical protein
MGGRARRSFARLRRHFLTYAWFAARLISKSSSENFELSRSGLLLRSIPARRLVCAVFGNIDQVRYPRRSTPSESSLSFGFRHVLDIGVV